MRTRNQKTLGASDLSSDLVASAYDAALEARRWPEVMIGLQALVKSRAALIISYNFRRKSGHIRYEASISPKFLKNYARLAPLDPWLGSESTPFRQESPCLGEIPGVGSRHIEDRFLREWLEPQNLYHSMHATLTTDGEVGEICTLLRSENAGPFKADEVAALDRVLPDLRRAWGIHETVASLNIKNDAMLAIVDHLSIGVVLVGRGCEVHEINERAREIISLDDGVWIDRGVLKAGSHTETEHLHTLVELAIDPTRWAHYAGADVVALSRPSGLPSVTVLVSPLIDGANVVSEPLAAIFLSEPCRDYSIDPRRLQRLYNLTPAEARLAALLAQGSSLQDAAAKLDVSLNTLRTHLKKVFGKTGTDRQAELVRIILSGVPSIGVTNEDQNGLISEKSERSIA